MKDRFEAEMRRVEAEMARLRGEFEGNQHSPRQITRPQHASPVHDDVMHNAQKEHSHTTSSYSTATAPGDRALVYNDRPRYDPYLDNLKSPLIRDETDGKTLRLRFNVKDYRPEEVTVKTVDNRLLVHAKHEEKGNNRSVFREYNQEFMLPRGTNPELITSTLSTDGVLTVEAPLPALGQAAYPAIRH